MDKETFDLVVIGEPGMLFLEEDAEMGDMAPCFGELYFYLDELVPGRKLKITVEYVD